MKLPDSLSMGPCRHIAMLAYTDSEILDICGPLDVFAWINMWFRVNEQAAEPAYKLSIIAPQAGPVTTSSGMRIIADAAYDAVEEDIDTLLLAGGVGTELVMQDRELIAWLERTAPKVRRIASICTGAFLLAEAGLLNGRSATTHWMYSTQLAQCYPSIRVEEDRIYVCDGTVYTSGGVTAGIDLALALVEEDWGHEMALRAARCMVVFMSRPGGQAQFSAMLMNEAKNRKDLRELQAWITSNPQADLSINALAAHMAMSPRNFSRVFAQEVGMPPAKFVELIRLEAARNKLQSTAMAIEEIARTCGFGNPENMRRTFQRQLKVSPQDYRMRFRTNVRV